jgi:hypothetical protein
VVDLLDSIMVEYNRLVNQACMQNRCEYRIDEELSIVVNQPRFERKMCKLNNTVEFLVYSVLRMIISLVKSY